MDSASHGVTRCTFWNKSEMAGYCSTMRTLLYTTRKLLLVLFVVSLFTILNVVVCYSQTSNVTATITDPDGQTWNNGTFIATFVPPLNNPQNPTCNGNPNFTKQFRGSMNGSGTFTVSVCDVAFLKPAGSIWQFTLCSNSSAPCQNATQQVTGASPNLSTQLSNQLIAPRFQNSQFAFGYSDTEVITPVQPGGFYWNVTSVAQRVWTGSAWVNSSSGASSLWSSLQNPSGNLSLTMGTNTSTFNIGDFGASPGTSFTITDNATSTTDTSTDLLVTSTGSSRHTPFAVQIQSTNQMQVCWQPGPQGEVVFGSAVTCPNISTTPFAKTVFMSATASHTVQRQFQLSASPTGVMQEWNFVSAPGTTFNVFKFNTGCSASDTETGCTTQSSLRGDGLFTTPIVNAATGFQIGGAAPNAHCLVGNGTNYVDSASCGSGGGLTGTGLPVVISNVTIANTTNIPVIDVRWFFSTPFPTYAQAQSQDVAAVINAALAAATPTGACVDLSQLNFLNAPNIAVYPALTNMYAGLVSNTYVPCLIGANFQLVTGVTQATPGGAIKVAGGAPGGIGGTGMVIQPCRTTGNCTVGTTTVPIMPTSADCVAGAGATAGLSCYATGLPSSSALVHYQTGTVTCSGLACTGAGTGWTTGGGGNIQVGASIYSSCTANTCTIGSTSGYVTNRVVAINTGAQTLTLQSTWTGLTSAGQNYIIFNPNTSVVWCDACLGNNMQKSFTGHQIDNLTIDMNGMSGAGFYTKASQEGSVLNNFTCFEQFGSPTGATAGGTCIAWDQTLREANASGQSFLGHWSVYNGRIGMGNNAGGANAFCGVVEGFSIMDGSVALSQANGASVFDLQACIGGSGRFQDAMYLDGFSGMNITGLHTESTLNDHFNIGPVNPVYNLSLNNITSSGTLGGCTVEFGTGSSGNRVSGVSRPSGGCLVKDNNLTTTTVATSTSVTPSTWTLAEYVQPANLGISIIGGGAIQADGPIYSGGPSATLDTACPTATVIGALCSVEGSVAVTPTLAVDTIRPDSTNHGWMVSLNNGTEFLSAMNLTDSGHGIEGPFLCPDSSGSGTAKVCNTSPTYTPVAGDCMMFTSTTANSGAGLTINWNSLGAKSVAKWQSTTTLAANDIRIGAPLWMCYDGTNIEMSSPNGNAPSGSGTVNSGTATHLAIYATSTNAVSNDATATDDGTTFTYSGTGGLKASAGPLTSGLPAGGVGSSFFLNQEGTVPAGLSTAGQDDCYADSTQHGILCNFNAGTTLPLITAANDTTTTHVMHATATNGVGAFSAIVTADIATALTTPGPIGGTTASTGSFTTLTGTTIKTTTNCAAAGTAANPSVASCSSAAAGRFSCATNASTGTCQVNTSAVTANSIIQIQPDSTLGAALSVTCNTTADSGLTAPRVSARSAGASFTITLGTFATNPECFSYIIIN